MVQADGERCAGIFHRRKLVRYEGPSTLNIQLNAQEEKNRDVLHILHYITEKRSEDIYTVEDKIPLYDLEIQVNTDGKQVKEVRSVPDETPLSFVQEGKYVKFSVKKSRRTSDDLYSILKEGDVLEICIGIQVFRHPFSTGGSRWKQKTGRQKKRPSSVVCC